MSRKIDVFWRVRLPSYKVRPCILSLFARRKVFGLESLVKSAKISSETMSEKKPKLIVFDLDYTLWPFWVDTHVDPPFRKGPNGDVIDMRGSKIKFYPDVPEVVKQLHEQGYLLGVASRTSEIPGANQLMDLFGWDKYFSYKEIYPGSKVTHFNRLKRKSNLEFKDMIFFDDEDRNIRDLQQQGVTSILVRNGVTKQVVEDGLKEYAKQHANE